MEELYAFGVAPGPEARYLVLGGCLGRVRRQNERSNLPTNHSFIPKKPCFLNAIFSVGGGCHIPHPTVATAMLLLQHAEV